MYDVGGNMMDTFINFLQTFFKLFLEVTVLFIFISFLVSWLQQKVTEDRIKRVLDRPNQWSCDWYRTRLNALTPSCSDHPMLAAPGLSSSQVISRSSMS